MPSQVRFGIQHGWRKVVVVMCGQHAGPTQLGAGLVLRPASASLAKTCGMYLRKGMSSTLGYTKNHFNCRDMSNMQLAFAVQLRFSVQ